MIMLKLGSGCKSYGCTHTHTHTHTHTGNFIEEKENGLNSNRIGFVNNVKKYINSRLNLKKIRRFSFKFGLLFCVYK